MRMIYIAPGGGLCKTTDARWELFSQRTWKATEGLARAGSLRRELSGYFTFYIGSTGEAIRRGEGARFNRHVFWGQHK